MTEEPRTVEDLYMCKTNFDFELGEASNGTKLYPSLETLKRDRPCTKNCGIVKVKVILVEVVQPDSYDEKDSS